ncbi:tyrosine-type recombinase/integrase [Oceaniglobus indicus]|uniref:tyrosine-type recombinase/integrase n=1 Tax=Oceaniglobus indicus TaxID=2047749 RepID=UPI000C17D6C7|nr:tyrosine-type recombinase/integrase [Oceaniglobus indicus]
MHDNLATRNDRKPHPKSFAQWTPRVLLEGANLTEESKLFLTGEKQICLEGAFEFYIETRSLGYQPGTSRLDPALGESWRRNSAPNIESAKRAWVRTLGNPFFRDIAREDVIPSLEEIRKLPKGHGKRRNTGADDEGLVGEDQTSPDRIGVTTFLKIGRAARQVGDFLVKLGLAEENPFDVCSWSTVDEARLRQQERPVDHPRWLDAVESYLSSPIFHGDIGDAGDPLFWIPLLMRLAGLRLGEAVHLTTQNLQYHDGIPVLCIERDAKTTGARREIPVSRRLQDLGLVGLFKLRQDQKETMLFPHVSQERLGTGTTRFRRQFVRYCETHGIDASALHFEDFRKALQYELLEKGCPPDIVRMAMGHVSREAGIRFLDDILRRTVRDALSGAGTDMPDIVDPLR